MPVLVYACETWTVTKNDENKLRILERKIVRKIYWPIQDPVNHEWRNLHNEEIYILHNGHNIVAKIKSRRLKWIGHVMRASPNRKIKQVTDEFPRGKRPLGRPRFRYMDNIHRDLLTLEYTNWILICEDRVQWHNIVCSAAKSLQGLRS